MQGAFDPRAIVLAKRADARNHLFDVFKCDRSTGQNQFTIHQTGFRFSTQVHDDLKDVVDPFGTSKTLIYVGWKDPKERFSVVYIVIAECGHVWSSFRVFSVAHATHMDVEP